MKNFKYVKLFLGLVVLAFFLMIGNPSSIDKQSVKAQNYMPIATPTSDRQLIVVPTPYPDTQHAIQTYLASKYNRPVAEVKVTVAKEVPGFSSGSVLFGQGGPGEGGMWLAVLDNGWDVVWDGNVDCNKMRHTYGFPDTVLKPNFCN